MRDEKYVKVHQKISKGPNQFIRYFTSGNREISRRWKYLLGIDIIEIKGVQTWIRKHCASSLIFGSGLFDWLAAALEGQKGLGVIGRSRQTNAQVN